jgi:transcription initiation factor IIE alpha subunit
MIMIKLTCYDCGLEYNINCFLDEAVKFDFKCGKCGLPIARPVTAEDRQALAAREWAKKEMGRDEDDSSI